jgi:hypothetical protein
MPKFIVTARRVDAKRQTVEADNGDTAVAKAIASPNFWHPGPLDKDNTVWEFFVMETK